MKHLSLLIGPLTVVLLVAGCAVAIGGNGGEGGIVAGLGGEGGVATATGAGGSSTNGDPGANA